MRYCGKCGAKVSETAIFCTECGCRLRIVESSNEIGNEQVSRSQPLDTHSNKSSRTIILAVIAGVIVMAVLMFLVYFIALRPPAQNEVENTAATENVGSAAVPTQETVGRAAIAPESTVEPIEQAYIAAFEQFLPIEAILPRDLRYGIYDIDKNGIPELIIEDYYNATESTYHIYTYDGSGASYIGSYPGIHSSLYEYNGSGFVYFSAMSGEGVIRLFSIDGGSLSIVRSVEVTPQNYHEPGEIFDGAESMIELHSYYDTQDVYKDNIYRDLNLSSEAKSDFIDGDIENYVVSFVRPLYNKINGNLSQYSVSTADGTTYWYDGSNCVKKSFQAGTNNYNMVREYYYNIDSGQIVFAFVWQDNTEYRLYFRANQLVRYIGPDGNVINNPKSEQALDLESYVLSEAY